MLLHANIALHHKNKYLIENCNKNFEKTLFLKKINKLSLIF